MCRVEVVTTTQLDCPTLPLLRVGRELWPDGVFSISKIAYTGAFQDLRFEYASVPTQLSRHEEWIKKLAEKARVKLEF